jgi:ribonucleotide monophosphatase NagD (HAD superfamily)
VNVGKGGSWLLPFLCEQYDILPSQACIIGDRLDTDIALGRQGGLQTVLPLSGVTKPAQLLEAESAQLPHYVVDNLAALAGISTC